jgi:hypothetical protein
MGVDWTEARTWLASCGLLPVFIQQPTLEDRDDEREREGGREGKGYLFLSFSGSLFFFFSLSCDDF